VEAMEDLLRRHGGNGAISDDARRQFRDGLWDLVAPGPAGAAARRVVGADRCFQLRHAKGSAWSSVLRSGRVITKSSAPSPQCLDTSME